MKIAQMNVDYIDHMGTDLTVVNAARVSFDKESEWEHSVYDGSVKLLSERDEKLIGYLAKHNHWTPFSHPQVTLRIKAPIFVARQWFKHMVGITRNETSRRYVDEEPEFYFPEVFRTKAEHVKQGSSDIPCVPKGKDGVCPSCGTPFVSNGNTQRYCSQKCQGDHYRAMPWGWRKVKLARLKSSAERRGIEFSLTEDDIEMPVFCPYIGIPLCYTNQGVENDSPSIDRINNDVGYVKGNVQTISSLANRMKGHATRDELLSFSKAVLMRHGGIPVEPRAGVLGAYEQLNDLYMLLIDQGVAPEQARMFLPQGAMTEWIETASLAAVCRSCKLRLDAHAQQETREIAERIAEVVAPLFPVSWSALMGVEK